ncbi:MAG: hypothetical protein K8T25_21230 [Planctomycetia bacterium]|nr:hypothetical protein [Planctomycetia bacterium]
MKLQRRFRRGSALSWAVGVAAAAVCLAAGLLIGQFARPRTPPEAQIPWPVFATATHGQDNFAVCTGQLDEGIEAIFFLDFLTGDLRAVAMNVRTHQFNAFYHRQIYGDMKHKGDVKNPRYLMVTGIADLQRGARNERMGRALVYVADINTGVCVAYGVPSTVAKTALGFQAAAPLVPVDRVEFRTTQIRD